MFSNIKKSRHIKKGDRQQFFQEMLSVRGRLQWEVAADSERLISLRSS